jgi:hypothetical protein
MLTSGVVLFHDNARPHTDSRTPALLDVFDHPPYSPDLAPRDYHLFTYLKNCLRSQRFSNNVLMKGVKMWLSSEAADFYDTDIQNLFPYTTNASIPAVTALRSSLSMHVFL